MSDQTVAPALAAELAGWAQSATGEEPPAAVTSAAALHLLDAIGVGLAGSGAASTPLPGPLSSLGAGESTVFGRSERLAPASAALANGAFIHSMEFDDTHVPSVVHGSAVIIPAALAVAEQLGASGAALLTGVIAGWETIVAIALASPGGFQAAGFQTMSAVGPFGAAIAAGVLQGLDHRTLTNALGICGSQASGIFAFLSNASTTKAMHAGWAAHSGILACELAVAGLTGPEAVFEDRFGLFATHTRDADAPERFAHLLTELGTRWTLPDAAFKFYPVCHYIHPFLEAGERLRADGLQAEEISAVHCRVPDGAASLISEPWDRKLAPGSDHETRWSLPVCLAQMLLRGTLSVSDMEGIAADPDVLALAARTSWEGWSDSGFPARFPAQVAVTTFDGRELLVEVDDVRGSASRPFSADEVRGKFVANAGPIVGEAVAHEIEAMVDELASLDDVRKLTALLSARHSDAVWDRAPTGCDGAR